MIRQIYSDLPKFKTLDLHAGLNVLVVQVEPGASDRQTRNRAGKSSLVEIVHFLLGSSAGRESLFQTDALKDATFGLDFDLGGGTARLERSGRDPSKIYVEQADPRHWPIQPTASRATGRSAISNTKWRRVLGEMMFGIDALALREAYGKFTPTFRSLFSYFARRQGSGGFVAPVAQAHKQQLWDQQVAVSFLLGLDWTIPHQLQVVRERETALKQLKAAARDGAFGSMISTAAELRTELTLAEDRVARLRRSSSLFRVLPEYSRLEQEAAAATREMGVLADDNALDRHLVDELEASIAVEEPPTDLNLAALYREAGVLLPELVASRFEGVRDFHESIVRNRRSYLTGELEAARRRIAGREEEMDDLDRRRAEILNTLRSHGALESFLELQAELARLEAQTEAVRQRFVASEQLEGQKSELEIDRQRIYRRLQQDYHEQSDILKRAILVFEGISQSLYEDAGRLTISESPNGPVFDVRIQGERSKGITNMQIFCFDMMLMQLATARGVGPGFLVHDSHLFDGVDSRQIAHALHVGAQLAEEHGFQYLVTMNSDDVPATFPDGFVFQEHVLAAGLTDASVEGGLFGFRF